MEQAIETTRPLEHIDADVLDTFRAGTANLLTIMEELKMAERRAIESRRPGKLARAAVLTGALLLSGAVAVGIAHPRGANQEAGGDDTEDVTPFPDGVVSEVTLESIGIEDGSDAETTLRVELASVFREFPEEALAIGSEVDWSRNTQEERGQGAFGFETLKSQEDIRELMEGDDERSEAARDYIEDAIRRDDLPQAEIDRSRSGESYLAVQVLDDAVIEGITYFDPETGEVKRANERSVEAGDVFWMFVDEDGNIHPGASLRADCQNPNIEQVRPRRPEERVPGVETPPTTHEATTTTTTVPETTTTTVPETTTTTRPEETTTTTVPETTTTIPETTTTTIPETTTTTVPETTTTTVPETTTTTIPETTTTTVPETTTTTVPETTTTTVPETTTTTPPTTAKPAPTYPEGENPNQTTATVNPDVTTPPEPTTSTTEAPQETTESTQPADTPSTTVPGIPVDLPGPNTDSVFPLWGGFGFGAAGLEARRRENSIVRRLFNRENWGRAIRTLREENR